jgi:hypothetical protein
LTTAKKKLFKSHTKGNVNDRFIIHYGPERKIAKERRLKPARAIQHPSIGSVAEPSRPRLPQLPTELTSKANAANQLAATKTSLITAKSANNAREKRRK